MDIPTAAEHAITLLYVEDDGLTQDLVAQALRLKFPMLNLLIADNGQEGFDLYTKSLPDIVVTDVRMPILDGIRMAKLIKEYNSEANIIILSAIDEVDCILEAINIGINNYLLKPLNIQKLVESIQQNINIITMREQLKAKDEYIMHMAFYDLLTGLPNRQLLSEFLKKALSNAQRNNRLVSVLSLDLDGFKKVNDTFGHAVGDDLIRSVAKRLRACCSREQDTVARWGGDEFIILLTDISSPKHAADVAQKIHKAFEQPFMEQNHELSVGISIGICMYPVDGSDAETLIRNADTAMYYAKKMGRNNYHFHTEESN